MRMNERTTPHTRVFARSKEQGLGEGVGPGRGREGEWEDTSMGKKGRTKNDLPWTRGTGSGLVLSCPSPS